MGRDRPLDLSNRVALSAAEVAEALGLSERKVRDLLPEIPHLYVGARVLIPVDELREWLRDRAKQEGTLEDQIRDVLDD